MRWNGTLAHAQKNKARNKLAGRSSYNWALCAVGKRSQTSQANDSSSRKVKAKGSCLFLPAADSLTSSSISSVPCIALHDLSMTLAHNGLIYFKLFDATDKLWRNRFAGLCASQLARAASSLLGLSATRDDDDVVDHPANALTAEHVCFAEQRCIQ